MRNVLISAYALCGLTAAAPKPQNINIEAALAVPMPNILGPKVGDSAALSIAYDPIAAAEAVAEVVVTSGVETKKLKRAACEVQPGG